MAPKRTPEMTAAKLRNTLPATGRDAITIPGFAGLQVRGNRHEAQWSIRMRDAHGRFRIPLGAYPMLDLDAAKKAAQVWAGRLAQGDDVRAMASAMRSQKDGLTVAELFDARRDGIENRTRDKERQNMRRTYSAFLERQAKSLTKEDWMKPIRKMRLDGKATSAENRLREIRSILNWAADEEREYVEPVLANIKAKQTPERDVAPTLEEAREIYTAAGTLGAPFGPLIQTLLLLGTRRTETSKMRWDQIDLQKQVWDLPASQAKNKQALLIPLPPAVIEMLESLEGDRTGFVFTTTKGKRPVSGFGKAATRLRKALSDEDGNMTMPDFVWHDFRSTFTTTMANERYDDALVDRCLNHKQSATRSKVSRLYNKAAKLEERRELLNDWQKLVQGETEPQTTIVEMDRLSA